MSFIFLEESGQFYYSYIKGITCIVLRYVTIFKEFKVQCIMLHRYINLQQISFYVIGGFFYSQHCHDDSKKDAIG